MSQSEPNDYPAMCDAVGLDCESCTARTARELALACPGLGSRSVGQLFAQLYSQPACSRMHAHFSRAYAEASSSREAEAPPKIRRMSAVAAFA